MQQQQKHNTNKRTDLSPSTSLLNVSCEFPLTTKWIRIPQSAPGVSTEACVEFCRERHRHVSLYLEPRLWQNTREPLASTNVLSKIETRPGQTSDGSRACAHRITLTWRFHRGGGRKQIWFKTSTISPTFIFFFRPLLLCNICQRQFVMISRTVCMSLLRSNNIISSNVFINTKSIKRSLNVFELFHFFLSSASLLLSTEQLLSSKHLHLTEITVFCFFLHFFPTGISVGH